MAVLPQRSIWAGPAEDQYAVAAGHYQQARWKLAAVEFRTFLADYPEHAKASRASFYLAESLLQLREFDAAITQFREFRRKSPTDRLAAKALFRAGEANYLAGHLDEAKAELSEFLKNSPDEPLNAYVLPYLGDIAAQQHDPATAQTLFNQGLERFPQGPLQDDCRFGLARALEEQGKLEDAQRLYLALASKTASPWADDAQFRLGASQYAAGDYASAAQTFDAFDAAFAHSEWKDKAALAAGQSLFYLQNYDQALARFQSLAEKADVGLEARYWIGLVQKAKREWEAASSTLLATATDADSLPLAAAIRFHAGDALVQAGKLAEAKAQFDLVLVRWPKGEFADDCWLGKMHAALMAGEHGTVDQLAAEFAQRFPASTLKAAVDRTHARSYLARKQADQAIKILEGLTATKPTPNAAPTAGHDAETNHYLLALGYLEAARYEDALKALQPVLALPDGELKIDGQRAQATALVGLGKFAEAIAPLRAYVAAHPQGEEGAWGRAELAISLARNKQLPEAKQAYAELLSQHAGHKLIAPTAAALAEAALAADDKLWSAELFASLVRDGNSPEYIARGLSGVAWSQHQAGESAQAAATFEQLVTRFPDSPLAAEAALVRGQLLEQLKQPEDALAMYRLVIDKYSASPQLAAALLGAARLSERLAHDADAAELYQRFDLEFPASPEHEAALYEWAWVLKKLNKSAEADLLFERLRSATPRGPFWADAVYRLAEHANQAKNYERANQLLTELIAGDPGPKIMPHALYLQSQVAMSEEQWQRATAPLERLINEYPDSALLPLARYFLAEVAYRQGDYQAAARQFDALAAANHSSDEKWLPMVALRQAQILALEKKWAEALDLAQQIAAKHPNFEQQYEVDYLIGRCLANEGRFDDARAAYRKVTRSESGGKTETAAMAQWMIGESYFHQKNYEAALREYLRVEILYAYPTWQAAALLQAGKCHEFLGEWKQASELYAKLLKTYPETTFAEEASKRLREAQTRAQAKN